MRRVLLALVFVGVSSSAFAQNPLTADPAHFQAQTTSDGVQVVKLTLPPGDTTRNFEFEPGYFVYLTDALLDVHLQDGQVLRGRRIERGEVESSAVRRPAMRLENPTSKTIEVLLIRSAQRP